MVGEEESERMVREGEGEKERMVRLREEEEEKEGEDGGRGRKRENGEREHKPEDGKRGGETERTGREGEGEKERECQERERVRKREGMWCGWREKDRARADLFTQNLVSWHFGPSQPQRSLPKTSAWSYRQRKKLSMTKKEVILA